MLKFKLDEDFVDKYKEKTPDFGFNGLGMITYYRTYSRLKDDGSKEDWWETVRRVVEGCYSIQKDHIDHNELGWNDTKAQRSAQEMYDRIFTMKFLPPGRMLWALGTPIIHKKKIGQALFNCAFISTSNIGKSLNECAKPFCFMMDMSMMGVGVGFDVKGENKLVVNAPDSEKIIFEIPDDREGWVESLKQLLISYFGEGFDGIKRKTIEFDYSKIRPAGLPIKGFGGLSSGHQPLKFMHEQIKQFLDKSIGNKISITNIVDIMNVIGQCVVAGNVRRCLPKGTAVYCADGIKKIEDVKVGDVVYTSNGTAQVSENVYQGEQDTIGIRTQLGTFYCTEKHRMAYLTAPGKYDWKMAKDLTAGDRLVFPENSMDGVHTELPLWEYVKSPNSTTCVDITIPKLDTDIAWFFGLLFGDGYVYPNFENDGFNAAVSISVHIDDVVIANKAKEVLERFGVNVTIQKASGNWANVRATSKQLAWYLSKFKTANAELKTPDFILNGTKEIRAAFLAGLFDADGCSKNRPKILVASVYESFSKEIQNIYASLSIPTRHEIKKDYEQRIAKGWQPIYNLRLVGERSITMCEQIVMPHSKKYKNKSKTKHSKNDFGFPTEWFPANKNTELNLRGWSRQSPQITTETFVRAGGELNGLIPIEVIEIVEGVKCETYDLSVPGANEFIAGFGLLVHNTAQIALGPINNSEYGSLKDYRWNNETFSYDGKMAHRAAYGWTSNNSVVATMDSDLDASIEQTKVNGEPGYIFIDNIRSYSRLCEPADNKDIKVEGTNPCGEQSLEHGEMCCLIESFPSRADSLEDYMRTLKFAYLLGKTATLVNTTWPETNRVQKRNRRIGTSVTGITNFLDTHSLEELKLWLTKGYDEIQKWDAEYSAWMCVPRSIKTTSVKPSGTVSLLAGVNPGCHFPEFEYYIRRIRLAHDSPMVEVFRKAGYDVEADVVDKFSAVISFPIHNKSKNLSQVSIWEQVSLAVFLQKWWSDNQVSSTITFRKDEADQIKPILDYFRYDLKSISFLPKLDSLAYAQMPYEAITKEKYDEMISKIVPVKWISNIGQNEDADMESEKFCNNDSCVVK